MATVASVPGAKASRPMLAFPRRVRQICVEHADSPFRRSNIFNC
jgi:hypothetical protein